MTNEFKSRAWFVSSFLLPLLLLGILLTSFLKFGPLGVFEAVVPPIEKLFVERVVFQPEKIQLEVFNDGPQVLTVSQLLVNESLWKFEMLPSNNLKPLESATVYLDYPWIDGDPIGFVLISSNGVTFEKDIDVAFLTPTFDFFYLRSFVLLGLYVGVIPILLGLLWFPFLRRLKGNAYSFLLSLTVGLLVFLGFDAFAESIELIGELPNSFNGVGVLVIGFLLAILILSSVTNKTQSHVAERGDHLKALIWSYLIALGIGLHNMGEGLAIGSAYAIGEIALGGTLVVGFMIHNITEGVAIVSPLTRVFKNIGKFVWHLFIMGLVAGIPTIIGTIIGGFAYSPVFAVLFLAVGAGAIFDVSFDILHYMAKGCFISLFTFTNGAGFLLGLLMIYLTGFLVLA